MEQPLDGNGLALGEPSCDCLTRTVQCLTITWPSERGMERINVRVDQRLKRELEAEAREKGVRPSVIVRQVLEEHIRRRVPAESCLELAERLGLIGCAKGLPADLSTNPKYMEGFGRD